MQRQHSITSAETTPINSGNSPQNMKFELSNSSNNPAVKIQSQNSYERQASYGHGSNNQCSTPINPNSMNQNSTQGLPTLGQQIQPGHMSAGSNQMCSQPLGHNPTVQNSGHNVSEGVKIEEISYHELKV